MPRGTKNPLLLKAVILAVALQEIGGGAVAPVIATMIADNPDTAATTIMMVSTIPFLAVALTSAVYSKVESLFPKRPLTIFSILLFCVTGIAPVFMGSNIPLIIAARFCFGISIGILVPLVMTLINDFYSGQERARMLGYVQTSGSIGGILFQTLGGVLGSIDWHYCFLAYLVSLLVLAFAFFALPNPPRCVESNVPLHDRPSDQNPEAPALAKASMLFLYACFCIYMMCIITFVNNLSILMANNGWGGADVAGLCPSAHTFAGMISSIFFGRAYGNLGKYALPTAIGIGCVALGVLYVSSSPAMVIIGSALLGVSASTTVAGFFNWFSIMGGRSRSSLFTSLGVCAQNLGQFAATYILAAILGAMGGSFGRDAFLIAVIACCIVTASLSAYMKFSERAEIILNEDRLFDPPSSTQQLIPG